MATHLTDIEEDQPKYVVFKTEELGEWRQRVGSRGSDVHSMPSPLDDAVVIRLKDPFAPTALYTYANTIMSLVELMEHWIDPMEHHRMIEIADYFHQQAVQSQTIKDKKLPD